MEWSKDDAARARTDGWDLSTSGYMRPLYGPDGWLKFKTYFELRKHMMQRALEDEWYRHAYISSALCYYDHDEAHSRFGTRDSLFNTSERSKELIALAANNGDLLAQKIVVHMSKHRFKGRE